MTSPYQPPGPYEPRGPGSGPETPPQSGPPVNYPPPPNYRSPGSGFPSPGQPPYGNAPYGQPNGAPAFLPPPGQPGSGGLPPAPPGYGGGPGGFPPAPPPKKSNTGKVILIVLGTVVALCVLAGIIGVYALTRGHEEPRAALPQSSQPFPSQAAPSSSDELTPSAAAPTPSGGPTYGSAKTVTDAGWTLTVNYLQCDIARLGTGSVAGTDAKGQYCVVNLTVKNGSNKSTRFHSSGQQAFDAADTEYRSDLVASTYSNYKDHLEFAEPISPGATANGFLAFDLPKGKKIAKLQLHAELFDTGVVVQVS